MLTSLQMLTNQQAFFTVSQPQWVAGECLQTNYGGYTSNQNNQKEVYSAAKYAAKYTTSHNYS